MEPSQARTICLIPARGGSKRIPRKNIIDFYGKPLLAYTLEAALGSGIFGDHIYVSSDSEEILEVAKSYRGVQAIRRPPELSGDEAQLTDVTLHLLQELSPTVFENLCLMMPTCPLRTSDDVAASYKNFQASGASCLMSVAPYNWLYPFWALEEKDGKLSPFFGEKYFIDSKSLPQKIYCPSGAVRWARVGDFSREKTFYGKDLAKYVIPFERSIDIDTPEDLELARKFYPLVYPKT